MRATALDIALRNEAKARVRIEEHTSSSPEKLFLPGLKDLRRAMPNDIARSSLFAPISRDTKKLHDQTVLVSRREATITYTGHQLDETQADIWMQLIFVAKNSSLGEAITIERAAFLRSIKRSTSGQNYAWLHRAMIAFTVATIIIEVRSSGGGVKYKVGHTKAFHMLANFDYDADTGTYSFTIDPRWKVLFAGRNYSLIDWEKRMQIKKGQDMAKALQRLVATSSELTQRFELEWLQGKLQYGGRWRDFKKALHRAMRELERVEVIAGGRIEISTKGKDQVAWSKL